MSCSSSPSLFAATGLRQSRSLSVSATSSHGSGVWPSRQARHGHRASRGGGGGRALPPGGNLLRLPPQLVRPDATGRLPRWPESGAVSVMRQHLAAALLLLPSCYEPGCLRWSLEIWERSKRLLKVPSSSIGLRSGLKTPRESHVAGSHTLAAW